LLASPSPEGLAPCGLVSDGWLTGESACGRRDGGGLVGRPPWGSAWWGRGRSDGLPAPGEWSARPSGADGLACGAGASLGPNSGGCPPAETGATAGESDVGACSLPGDGWSDPGGRWPSPSGVVAADWGGGSSDTWLSLNGVIAAGWCGTSAGGGPSPHGVDGAGWCGASAGGGTSPEGLVGAGGGGSAGGGTSPGGLGGAG
jgi:hypothetical protein